MKFKDYYTEKEALELLGLSKYKFGKLDLPFERIGGNGVKIYKVTDIEDFVEENGLDDPEYQKRLRYKTLARQRLNLDMSEWVPIDTLLDLVKVSRQRVNQLIKRPDLGYVKIWGMNFYDVEAWLKR